MAVSFTQYQDNYSATTGLPAGDTYTFATWARLASDRDAYSTVLEFLDSVGGGGAAMWFQTDTDGTSLYAEAASAVFGPDLNVGTWYKLALIVDGDSMTIHAAPQGDPMVTYSGTSGGQPSPIRKMILGNEEYLGWLDGDLAAPKLWDGTLSASEVDAEFEQFDPARLAGLIRYHRFRTAATATTDDSGNGHTLTVGGNPTTAADPPGVPETAIDTSPTNRMFLAY